MSDIKWKIVILILSKIICGFSLQCMDQDNKPVDWYAVYKLPKEPNSDNLIAEGVKFVYVTSNDYWKWIPSKVGINDTKSMVAYTLNDLFDSQPKPFYILYNDQPPNGSKSFNKGHTKGVVMAEENGGFWLIHSVPHFPYSLNEYSYPTTGVHYGQSLLCISLDLENLNFLGLQLQYNDPEIFAQHIDPSLEKSVPELVKAAQNVTIKNSPWFNIKELTSKGGAKFTSFAKSAKFDKDLYSDLVAPSLQSDLYVETWPNEPNRLPSDCTTKFQVDNVISMSISAANLTFTSTKDHSKWAVSPSKDKNYWICIGDINRAERQTKRGGGTACFSNKNVATLYQNSIQSVQECT